MKRWLSILLVLLLSGVALGAAREYMLNGVYVNEAEAGREYMLFGVYVNEETAAAGGGKPAYYYYSMP